MTDPGFSGDGDGLIGTMIDENGCQRAVEMAGNLQESGNPAGWQLLIQYVNTACQPLGTDGNPAVDGDNAYEFLSFTKTTDTDRGNDQTAHGAYYHPDDCMINADTGTVSIQLVPETGNWLVQITGAKTTEFNSGAVRQLT